MSGKRTASANDCCPQDRISRSQIAATFLIVVILWYVLDRFGLGSLFAAPHGTIGFGEAFVVGIVAAFSSCLALVGGLLLSVSARWRENQERNSHWERFFPLFLFNMGRLLGYFLLGGVVGMIGAALNPSTVFTGLLTIAIAILMLWLGLGILGILPKKYCSIPLPAGIQRGIRSIPQSANPILAIALGAATFFIPCGFTQSMQLIALNSHSFLQGALIMLAFALGTLPALLGISLVSAFSEGGFARFFLVFSGVLVILLGVKNAEAGLVLTGVDVRTIAERIPVIGREFSERGTDDDPYVSIDSQGRQIISLTVTDRGYEPNSFTIQAGKPTWVYAVAPTGPTGCATFLLAPTFNLTAPIREGGNWLGPIEDPEHDFLLTCSMGMLKASVHVKPTI